MLLYTGAFFIIFFGSWR